MTRTADSQPVPFDPNAEAVALRSLAIVASGSLEEFEQVIHPDCVNHEARTKPPACRGRGAAAMHATAVWLRDTFEDLRWDIHEVVAERDIVVVHCTVSGRHAGDAVMYDVGGRVAQVFPPTGARFAATQSHWFRVADGKVVEHWANRDDVGTATQLGWLPPRLPYLLRMARAKRRARRRRRA